MYFEQCEGKSVAWEVGPELAVTPELIRGRAVYQLSAVDARPQHPDSYFTRAVQPHTLHFTNRFMRCLKKSKELMPEVRLEEAETAVQIRRSIGAFEAFPERRDMLDMSEFTRRVTGLVGAHAMRIYSLRNGENNLGTVCVLLSDTQANLRHYTASRQNYAGHRMHQLLIEQLFENEALGTIDLSGASPFNDDKIMQSIDEYKKQFGGVLVEFMKRGED